MSTLLLKIIASITMLGDHIGYFLMGEPSVTVQEIGTVLRALGRIAFPIYCYLIAFGYRKTHNKWLYLVRLAVLSIISEFPYNFTFYGKFPSFDFNNVYFTLILGLLAITLFDLIYSQKPIILKILAPLPVFVLALLAKELQTDYDLPGVILIFGFHLFNKNKILQIPLVVWFAFRRILYPLIFNINGLINDWSWMQIYSLAAIIPILLCNGERGFTPKTRIGTAAIKYGFYFFYPVHIFIIGLTMR